MPESLTAEAVPFTPERAALVRASCYADALSALLEARRVERREGDAGPVFVDAVEAFGLDPAGTPSPASERLWALALAGLVAEGVGPLEVEGISHPGPDGRDVCQLSARLCDDMTTADLTHLLRWTMGARELARLRLLDGLAYCERLAGEVDPKAPHAARLSGCGGALLGAVRELAGLVGDTPGAPCESVERLLAVGDLIDRHASELAEEGIAALDAVPAPLALYVCECLSLRDRVADLVDRLDLEPPGAEVTPPETPTPPPAGASA